MAMGTFTSDKVLYGNPKYIPALASKICKEFTRDGFETTYEGLGTGGCDISIAKGGIFKAVVGMKSALKVTLTPQNGNIYIKAGVGIFGQQAIPTAITFLVFWPVALAQIWGMVQQSKLDDKAVEIAEAELKRLTEMTRSQASDIVDAEEIAVPDEPMKDAEAVNIDVEPIAAAGNTAIKEQEQLYRAKFCHNCGAPLDGGKFCSNCGAKIE